MKNLYSVFFAWGCSFLLGGCMSRTEPPEAQDTLLRHEAAARKPRHGTHAEGSDKKSGPRHLYARGVDTEPDEELLERNPNISLAGQGSDPVYADESKRLETTFFGFDESSLTQESRQKLKDLVRKLPLEDPSARILVVGRADWFGSEDYNMSLGDRRARAVLNYLTAIGVPASRMELLSRGKLDATPGQEGDPKSLSAQDRRADIYKLWP